MWVKCRNEKERENEREKEKKSYKHWTEIHIDWKTNPDCQGKWYVG